MTRANQPGAEPGAQSGGRPDARSGASRKNILFLMTDQHRTDTLGAYGNPLAHTPALDELAATGTRFDRWYTPTAICTPARASLLTGQAPFRHKLLANHERNVGYLEDLAEDQFAFSRALREHGYNCGLFGKWHTGNLRTAADYGFDGPHLPGWHNPVDHPDYLAYLAERGLPPYEISDRIRGTLPNGGPGNLLAARLHQPVEATFEHYLATRAIEQLERYAADVHERERPFFLALHFFGPHLPYILPDEYFDLVDPADVPLPRSVSETFEGKPPVQRNYSAHWTFDTMPIETTRKLIAVYWGYVALIDRQIARVTQAMERLGLTDDTAVFFTCDHGEFTGSHRLHDKGPAMYEDIYRTPGLLRADPQLSQGRTRHGDSRATAEKWRALAQERGLSIRQTVIEAGARQSFVGTPGEVAAELTEFVRRDAADGFILVPHLTPGGLDEFVDRVVPLLQERGAFRTAYEGDTLRSHLGLAEPVRKA
ncbi:sulfatase-like hydrolase/transferase [Streptomyces ardesiacus]